MNKFLWQVRRELWEARTVWVVPLALATVIIVFALIAAFVTGTITIDGLDAEDIQKLHSKLTPEKVDGIASLTLGFITVPFFMAVLFTQFFYALDALYGERRDRAILFWKSLPVNDTQAVLGKLFVASVVMPAVAAVAALGTQIVLFTIAGAKLAPLEFLHGHLWTASLWGGDLGVLMYGLIGVALWFLPMMGWCLLVSAWAPRSPIMYATLPPLLVALAEWIVFHTANVWHAVFDRVGNLGFLAHFTGGPHSSARGFGIVIDKEHLEVPRSVFEMMRLDYFFTTPKLWIGVLVGAALVAAAIWVRRTRDEAG